ncbi:serine/threonine-protein kinase, partial [Streptomyces sp. NPDC060194]|uniref:serine/threonine-protein kinase n=1 Tax=Streptomyces sp. NPDC060194 TaxID=3347069 RepID=UPI003658B7C1
MSGPGDHVDGRFELLELLGSGGMGAVWRARDTVLDREVALKEVRASPAESPALRERVLREARALARLNHPHVVTVHQIIDSAVGPHPWIVMELLPGRTLQDRIEAGPLPFGDVIRIGRQVLSALDAAHRAGIHHRDVKPANVLLRNDGSAVLTDFGIAALQGSTSLTATGELIGSPEYIAPERIRGHDETPASDLWSLGLVLYVCVEGISPMRRASTLATLAAVLDDPVPPPVRSGPLAPVLAALLARDPAVRPDAAELDAMLAAAAAAPDPTWDAVGPGPYGTLPGWDALPTRTSAVRPDAPPPVPPPGPAPGGPATPRPPVPAAHPTPSPAPWPVPAGPPHRSPAVVATVAVAAVAVALVAAAALVLALREPGGGRAGGGGTDGSGRSSAGGPGPASTSASPQSASTGTGARTPGPSGAPSQQPPPGPGPGGGPPPGSPG